MKTKIFLSILAVSFIVSAYSQKATMELSFTAMDNGQYVPLDSILIENLTQGGDTTLYEPDTVLVLDYATNIYDRETIGENRLTVSQNYPNPFSNQTKIDIYLPEKEKTEIVVRDILGRKLVQNNRVLDRGVHSFIFYPGNEQYYLFTVTGNQTGKTIKMLNINRNTTFNQTNKIVYSAYYATPINFKSQKAIYDLIFNPGDQLSFTGYAKTINDVNGSDVIVDAPETNEFYEFNITEGIPCPGIPFVDYEGQVYNTVYIGSQCWLKENMNVGIMINGNYEMEDNSIIEKYCYADDLLNCETFGGLYQWGEMMQYSSTQGIQGLCPPGWHLPTNEEWNTTVDTLGGYSVAGGKMKEVGTLNWNPPNTGASNESGFTGLPGGFRITSGNFSSLGNLGHFWTSTEYDTDLAWSRSLVYNFPDM